MHSLVTPSSRESDHAPPVRASPLTIRWLTAEPPASLGTMPFPNGLISAYPRMRSDTHHSKRCSRTLVIQPARTQIYGSRRHIRSQCLMSPRARPAATEDGWSTPRDGHGVDVIYPARMPLHMFIGSWATRYSLQ